MTSALGGFGVHNRTTIFPSDTVGLHKLACYLMRSPVNLSRLRYHADSHLFVYEPKAGQLADEDPLVDPLEFLARVLIHIPEPKKHLVLFYGVYAHRIRATYRPEEGSVLAGADDDPNQTISTRGLSRRWAELIYRIYEVDPLDCPRCGASMKILTFITDPKVIRQILDHLDQKARPRAPPRATAS